MRQTIVTATKIMAIRWLIPSSYSSRASLGASPIIPLAGIPESFVFCAGLIVAPFTVSSSSSSSCIVRTNALRFLGLSLCGLLEFGMLGMLAFIF